jgi:hypothetical protein
MAQDYDPNMTETRFDSQSIAKKSARKLTPEEVASNKQIDFAQRVASAKQQSFVDGSDGYANRDFRVTFTHVASDKEVSFKAFISAYNETYNSDWASEAVFGRADPIHTFKNTTRRISMALLIPASTEGEGYQNLGRVQRLVQFLYPSYTNVNNANTINQSPLVRIKVMNLLANRANIKEEKNDITGRYRSIISPKTGVLAAIQNLNVNQNLDNPSVGVFELARGIIVPKLIEINVDFDIIHEHSIGWQEGKVFGDAAYFPYGIDLNEALGETSEQKKKNIDADTAQTSTEQEKQRIEETGQPPSEAVKQENEANLIQVAGQLLKSVRKRPGRGGEQWAMEDGDPIIQNPFSKRFQTLGQNTQGD